MDKTLHHKYFFVLFKTQQDFGDRMCKLFKLGSFWFVIDVKNMYLQL